MVVQSGMNRGTRLDNIHTTHHMKFRNLFLIGVLACEFGGLGQSFTFDFNGSTASDWEITGSSVTPVLNTVNPGSVSANGPMNMRNNSVAFDGSLNVGDMFRIRGDFNLENRTVVGLGFASSSNANSDLLGLQINIADSLQISELDGWFGIFSGKELVPNNLGGISLLNGAISVELTYTISSATTADVSGSISDSTGVLWDSEVSLPLDGDRESGDLFPYVTLFEHHDNDGVSVGLSDITQLSWEGQLTAVPEPSEYATVFGLALLGMAVYRRRNCLRRNPTEFRTH